MSRPILVTGVKFLVSFSRAPCRLEVGGISAFKSVPAVDAKPRKIAASINSL